MPILRAVLLLLFSSLVVSVAPSRAQLSPQEVSAPELKALTSEYFQKLIALNRQITAAKFPFPFHLARYIGLDPKNQLGSDTRGLEFVQFHERTIFKCSGNYNAAFSAKQFNRNQRADHVFSKVVVPILHMLPELFGDVKDFEGVGFEISYHVRGANGKADYEGKENLVIVLPVTDALRFWQLRDEDEQQEVLNGSEVYLSGERFGLALGKVDALSVGDPPGKERSAESVRAAPSASRHSEVPARANGLNLSVAPGDKANSPSGVGPRHPPSLVSPSPLTPADVDGMQAKYQSVLETFGKQIDAVMHQESSSAPDLALIRGTLYVQFTLRNPESFSKENTSLYKRAALSFDTFLAPHLGDLLAKLPAIPSVTGLNVTVLVKTSAAGSTSEAIEYMCPITALRSFAAFEITNQELIDQSIVIVNGVRIALNLQQVE